ncbi:hypothetical protein RBU49_05855 [Clostridium sp. MB40-C1]|uniref:hypothetical protein n=1 Tax=Clostridium sp. MB40-C1 TaxID=3070996 RepID=UPI0027E1CC03|nr:hypothetical protein [Clostridium sp. MB40-C1]WMJ81767.1 hypothetical protein RBU49_05855 [Clostridium sp. MB40-C1]
MKLKKKTAMAISFTVGILMFATTVLAEVSSKSGYEQGKDALKYSAASFENKYSNYTIDFSTTLKDNGKIIMSENTLGKYDVSKHASENTDTKTIGNKKSKFHCYSDKNTRIIKNSDKDVYNVTEFKVPDSGYAFENPFKREGASDIEKIADALVGNLKDYVVVTNKPDGNKELSGSVSQTQIPALINAVSSYMLKNEVISINRRDPSEKNIMPSITKDIYLKEVKGKMLVDKNGLIQNVFGIGTLNGKDDKGKEHNLTFELLVKISNINSTVVNKPNLSGSKIKKVIKNNEDEFANPEKYIGKYKNNIIIEKDGKFQKIGERLLTITHSDANSIKGTYHEQYLKGYENYAEKMSDIKFDAKYGSKENGLNADFKIEGLSQGGNISIDIRGTNIYFNIPKDSYETYDSHFIRIFD